MKFTSVQRLILSVFLLFLAAFTGYTLGKNEVSISWRNYRPGLVITSKEPQNKLNNVDFSLFWDVWDRVGRTYYDKKLIDPQKMLYGAISGMLQSLGDPYTVFLNPTQNSETKQELKGEFEGIGAQLGLKDKKIVVIAPLLGTPAEKAKVLAGDAILKIDGKDTSGITLPEAVQKIRGPKGTSVTLTLLHEKETEPVDIAIVRDTITVKSVDGGVKQWKMEDGKWKMEKEGEACDNCQKVAYIRLSQFGDNTNSEWLKVVGDISAQTKDPNLKGLILDLRNNPGGYLTGAVFIASEFIDSGTVVIQEREGQRNVFPVDRKGVLTKIPLVVLINKGSASASEIVAGALRDQKRAKLVGETSFGKGTVQEAVDLPQNAGLHITTAKWLTPNGTWVSEKGLTPDVTIELDKNDPTRDLQLERAVEELTR